MNIEKLEKIFIKIIKKAPVDDLKSNLNNYTKDILNNIYSKYNESFSSSINKESMVQLLFFELLNRMKEKLLDLPEECCDVIYKACTNSFVIKSEADIIKISVLNYCGYIYVYYDKSDKCCSFIIPKEIRENFMSIYNDDFIQEKKIYSKKCKYLRTLLNIYKVVNGEQYIKVWNLYNDNKLNENDFYEFINEIEDIDDDFWKVGNNIVSCDIETIEEYSDLMEASKGKEYYIPTEKEIDMYELKIIDDQNKYYKDFYKFINNKLKDNFLTSMLLEDITDCIVADRDVKEVFALVDQVGMEFNDINDANKFMELYTKLHNNMRLPVNRGFTPNELMKLEKKNFKKITIGRNDPCPCGSGKKYKRCCGK